MPKGRKSADAVLNERAVVLSVIRSAREALSRDQIRAGYQKRAGAPIAYNTVKARLEELVSEGQLRQSPKGQRPALYEIAFLNPDPEPRATESHRAERPPQNIENLPGGIRLTAPALEVQRLIRRPRSERTPIGYDVDFLVRYNPGETWYLDAAERARLYERGRTTSMGQPAGTYAREIMQRLVIDLSWSSSRLEGLKYSRIDTEELLNNASTPAGVSDRDRQVILNHKGAIEFLVEEAAEIGFNRHTMMNIHALLAENLLDNREDEGALRTRAVIVGSSVYTSTAIPQLIEECFNRVLSKADAIPDPIEQAFFMMVHIPYLQPFMDVNKRTSRLAANISLIQANLCPLSFVDVPEQAYTEGTLAIYENKNIALLRDVFVWAYERSCAQFKVLREAMGEPHPIRLNYRNELRELVRDAVRALSWPTDEDLQVAARELVVPDADRNAFVIEARKDLKSLRTNILARYSLRNSEFERWAAAVADRR
ncbi:MAG: Fic family protein [Gemmatimonadaceae bacterium]